MKCGKLGEFSTFQQEFYWGEMAQGRMRANVIVHPDPCLSVFPDFQLAYSLVIFNSFCKIKTYFILIIKPYEQFVLALTQLRIHCIRNWKCAVKLAKEFYLTFRKSASILQVPIVQPQMLLGIYHSRHGLTRLKKWNVLSQNPVKQSIQMIGNNLLDTCIVIELFKGNPTITAFLETLEEEINIPFAVLGELYLGAYKSANPRKHIEQINSFLERCNILIADNETANHYALIKAALLKKVNQYQKMTYG